MIDFTIPPDLQDVRDRVAAFVRVEVLPAEEKLTPKTFARNLVRAMPEEGTTASAAGGFDQEGAHHGDVR